MPSRSVVAIIIHKTSKPWTGKHLSCQVIIIYYFIAECKLCVEGKASHPKPKKNDQTKLSLPSNLVELNQMGSTDVKKKNKPSKEALNDNKRSDGAKTRYGCKLT